MHHVFNTGRLKRKPNKYIFLLGILLIVLGIGLGQVMSVMGIPLDIAVHSDTRSSFSWHGSALIIDARTAKPSGVPTYKYGIFVLDNKHGGSLWIILCGDGSLTIAGTRNAFAENTTIEPYGIAGVYSVLHAKWIDSKIVVSPKNHTLVIMGAGEKKTVFLSPEFSPDQILLSGTRGQPSFTGEIRIYGGYIVQHMYESSTPTHATQALGHNYTRSPTPVENTPISADVTHRYNLQEGSIIIGVALIVIAIML